jgi:hypothetical protein
MQTYRSLYQPISHYGEISKQWYIIAGGTWYPVKRRYAFEELVKAWEKITYSTKPKAAKTEAEPIYYTAEGSKGKTYEIVNDNSKWTCSCPAFGFSRGADCKHIKLIKSN